MAKIDRLTEAEVRKAARLGLFTVTSETGTGYYVTCLRMRGRREPAFVSQGVERARYGTAARDGVRLVRAAMAKGAVR